MVSLLTFIEYVQQGSLIFDLVFASIEWFSQASWIDNYDYSQYCIQILA